MARVKRAKDIGAIAFIIMLSTAVVSQHQYYNQDLPPIKNDRINSFYYAKKMLNSIDFEGTF